jgi:hypothetical protein
MRKFKTDASIIKEILQDHKIFSFSPNVFFACFFQNLKLQL